MALAVACALRLEICASVRAAQVADEHGAGAVAFSGDKSP